MKEKTYKKIWSLSPSFRDSASYAKLTKLTKALIELYDVEGRLNEHPFTAARKRELSLPSDRISQQLAGSVCLVTGGLGCVGTAIVKELVQFGVKRIILVDSADYNQAHATSLEEPFSYLQCDILDFQAVKTIFAAHRPDFVFHTAAQRNPGYAERHVAETVQTNVIGTFNIVQACEQTASVKQCIFSSTGKASRYFTEEVYAATKKVCEFILDTYARQSATRYAMVRFTHILDNSLMEVELRRASTQDHVAVHSPGKFVTAQNVQEAARLMLNALLYSEDKQCKFLLVRNLEWPVESLQMALYFIKNSGQDIPVIFKGNPTGYTEEFFRGQLDWSDPSELNLLINVYENKRRSYNQEEDIVISHILPTDRSTLLYLLAQLQAVKGEKETKECLLNGLELLVKHTLQHAPKKETMSILKWGLQFPSPTGASASSLYGKVPSLLLESLANSKYAEQANALFFSEKIAA